MTERKDTPQFSSSVILHNINRQLPIFRRIVMPSSAGLSSPRTKGKGTTSLRNIGSIRYKFNSKKTCIFSNTNVRTSNLADNHFLCSEFLLLNESQWENLETDMWRKRKAGINLWSQRECFTISSDMVKVNIQVSLTMS
jgi:hypothetical protein